MRDPRRVIVTRVAILYVAKQALLACKKAGCEVTTQRDVEQIMTCCLMANDLLLGRMPAPDETTIDKAASLLPFSGYVSLQCEEHVVRRDQAPNRRPEELISASRIRNNDVELE